jgi:hypothetical protein
MPLEELEVLVIEPWCEGDIGRNKAQVDGVFDRTRTFFHLLRYHLHPHLIFVHEHLALEEHQPPLCVEILTIPDAVCELVVVQGAFLFVRTKSYRNSCTSHNSLK